MTPTPFRKGEVVYHKDEGEYVVVRGDAWENRTHFVRILFTRCGDTEVVPVSVLRRLSKTERGQ